MKKILTMILVLCMMTAVLPALAESAADTAGSGLEEMLSDILKSEDSSDGKTGRLLSLISDLKKQFSGHDAEFSVLLSGLGRKLETLLSADEKGLGSLLSGLKDKLSGGSDFDPEKLLSGLKDRLSGDSGSEAGSLLSSLFGGSGPEDSDDEWTEEDDQEFYDTVDQLNKASEAETGENVPGRKAAESIEEFYGTWTETKFVYNNEEYDMTGNGQGVVIAENTYYITEDGEIEPEYPFPVTAELSLRDGVLKVKRGEDNWTTYVLTQNGEMVMVCSFMAYFTRTGE